MTDFFHSWAFAFIIGCFVGGCFGFLGAALMAVSGRASRMEEKISDTMFKTVERGKLDFSNMTHKAKIVTKNNPRTD